MPRSIDDLVAQPTNALTSSRITNRTGATAANQLSWRCGVLPTDVLIERELIEIVRQAREAGASWSKIGKELGTTG